MARIATLRAALGSESEELADVRRQLGALAATMQALPAVGALTLALFGTLGASPQYQRLGPTILLATGLLPFVVLVVVSAREFGRAADSGASLDLSPPDDALPFDEWLVLKLAERRLEQKALRRAIDRKRGRLRLASAVLAIQVGYLLVVVILVALVWPSA
jgi:hypothetical protein